jgi:hypothetical protein
MNKAVRPHPVLLKFLKGVKKGKTAKNLLKGVKRGKTAKNLLKGVKRAKTAKNLLKGVKRAKQAKDEDFTPSNLNLKPNFCTGACNAPLPGFWEICNDFMY